MNHKPTGVVTPVHSSIPNRQISHDDQDPYPVHVEKQKEYYESLIRELQHEKNATIGSLTEKNTRLCATISKLKDQLRQRVDVIVTVNDKYKQLKQAYDLARDKVKQQKAYLATVPSREELLDLQHSKEQLEKDNDRLSSDVALLKCQLRNAKKAQDDLRKDNAADVERLRLQNESLQLKYDQLEDAFKAISTSASTNEIGIEGVATASDIEKRFLNLSKANRSLEAEMKQMRQLMDIKQDRIKHLEVELNACRGEVRETKLDYDSLTETLKSDLEVASDRCQMLEKDVRDLQQSKQAIIEDLFSTREELNQFRQIVSGQAGQLHARLCHDLFATFERLDALVTEMLKRLRNGSESVDIDYVALFSKSSLPGDDLEESVVLDTETDVVKLQEKIAAVGNLSDRVDEMRQAFLDLLVKENMHELNDNDKCVIM